MLLSVVEVFWFVFEVCWLLVVVDLMALLDWLKKIKKTHLLLFKGGVKIDYVQLSTNHLQITYSCSSKIGINP